MATLYPVLPFGIVAVGYMVLRSWIHGATAWYCWVHGVPRVGYMVLPLGTFSPRVDGCNTPGRTQHLQLVDDPGGSAQDDEDEDKDEDKNGDVGF